MDEDKIKVDHEEVGWIWSGFFWFKEGINRGDL